MLLEQVRTVAVALNDTNTAEEMMCSVEAYREARKVLGRPCVTRVKEVSKADYRDGWDHNDPYIRRRMGLPPA